MLMVGGSLEFVEGLSPERVHSFQLSFAGNKWAKGLDFEVNGFYNRAEDLISIAHPDFRPMLIEEYERRFQCKFPA